ncbi:MAG: DUF4859 domain-containing protein [Muribaculaceae bacterium]|nr:DUF4859 domain-containing protein [Muribaculaceae bacterium]
MKKLLYGTLFAAVLGFGLTACNDDDDVNFNGDYIIVNPGNPTSFNLAGTDARDTIKVSIRTVWNLALENEADASWLSFTPSKGTGGIENIILTATDNGTGFARSANLILTAEGQTQTFSVSQSAADFEILDPASIPDYDKFFPNSQYGQNILRSDANFSFFNYAQSDHFFVFWDASYFGKDPGAASLGTDAVNISDLLEKAEMFFDSNVNYLHMADLGQGKSYLDQYKMQIYILDPTPEWWVATGSGYDDVIGALWVTPSTMQPVGWVIGHEIGHSFQYQVYCDKILQGEPYDFTTGFRYNPWDGQGCGYWEQCAQWQAFQTYPDEMFNSDFGSWAPNAHRHFHHEWMRYASYWLQSYWVNKHGVDAFAAIWKNNHYPQDAIETYTNLYNGGFWQLTRDELADYALRMATFDIDNLPAQKQYYVSDVYSTNLMNNDDGSYQVAYSSCPGATGFNVIRLNFTPGESVTLRFEGLPTASPLNANDPGNYINGDYVVKGQLDHYNVGGLVAPDFFNGEVPADLASIVAAQDAVAGWRYGFVAYGNGKRTYSSIGRDRNGLLSFTIPADAEILYLVVQGSPEEYVGCPWDEEERNDYQFPYKFWLEGAKVQGAYNEFDIDYNIPMGDATVSINLTAPYDQATYGMGSFDGVNHRELAQAFHLQPQEIEGLFVGTKEPVEGKIVMRLKQPDGTFVYRSNTNAYGWWVSQEGYSVGWGSNAYSYIEFETLNDIPWGMMPYEGQYEPGTSGTQTPQLVYTLKGKQYVVTLEITITLQ